MSQLGEFELIERYFKRIGGWMTKQDLASHHAQWTKPLVTNYHGTDVYGFIVDNDNPYPLPADPLLRLGRQPNQRELPEPMEDEVATQGSSRRPQ